MSDKPRGRKPRAVYARGRHGEQFAGTGDVAGARAVGEEAVVADAVEALGQDVDLVAEAPMDRMCS